MRAETFPPQVSVAWDLEEAQRFLAALDPAASHFTFQMLSDSGAATPKTRNCSIGELWPEIQRWNSPAAGMGVFVTINETDLAGRRAENVVRARAIFVDADGQDAVDRCHAFIASTGADPSAVVSTSPSKAHFYWFVDDLALGDFLALQEVLIDKLGTDPAVKDLPRIMRLPGTLHLKDPGAPHKVSLVTCGGPRWQLSSLLKMMDLKGVTSRGYGSSCVTDHQSAHNVLSFPQNPLPGKVDNSPLSAGIDTGHWYEGLTPEQKDVCLQALLDACKDISESHSRQPWLSILMAAKASGAPSAREIALEWCQRGGEAFCGDAEFDRQWRSFAPRRNNHDITIGTLIRHAVERGFDASPWRAQADLAAFGRSVVADTGTVEQGLATRRPLRGGTYDSAEALNLLNSWFFLNTSDEETSIYRIKEDGTACHIPEPEFKLLVDNIRVRDGEKIVAAEKFWKQHPNRAERRIVFKPSGSIHPNEHNLWRGFAITPKKGCDMQKRLLHHMRKVICRGDREKLKYLMRWLAWTVQHPDEAPGTMIVLKSRNQGTGKSTLGKVMCDIFGSHARTIDDKEQLLGRFNADLENACFVLAEEVFWAGDHKTADKLKSRITAPTIPIEPKYRQRREVPNRLHIMMTTNHDHAVAAGICDRRFFVLDVSSEHAQDKAWFAPLYKDLGEGGSAQFLWLLLNWRLGDWHPRELMQTDEAIEQQRMSGDSVTQWSRACIEADAIVAGATGSVESLGRDIPTNQLYDAYANYCRQASLRPVNDSVFGKALTAMFGPRRKLPAQGPSGRRPSGYSVPSGDDWQEVLDRRLSIRVR